MIRELFPEAVAWLPEEVELLARLAAESGGHLRCPRDDRRLYYVEDVLEDLAQMHGGEPEIVTVNCTDARWHRDAKAYSNALIAWIVRGVDGGALEWAANDSKPGGVYTPRDGDVARIDGNSFLHRVTPWKETKANARRVSVVLV